MISSPIGLLRTPLAPVAALLVLIPVGGLLALGRDDGAGVETVAGASATTVPPTLAPSTTTPPPVATAATSAALPTPADPGPEQATDDNDAPETAPEQATDDNDAPEPAPEQADSNSGEEQAVAADAEPVAAASGATTSTSPPTIAAAPSSNCSNPWPNLESCGWPGPTNTGPRSANCPNGLSTDAGATNRQIRIDTANTVISCQRITGALVIVADNVTVRDSIVTFDGGGGNGGGVIVVGDGGSATIEHVEINGLQRTHACVWHQGNAVTIDAVNCRGTVDGVFAWARTGVSMTSGDNFTIRNSYFHSFTHAASNGHIDGFQTEGAANGVISRNTFDMPPAANSAISIWNSAKNSSNISVTGNLLAGAQYTVYAHDYHPSASSPGGGNTVTNITFTNNVFSTKAAACVGVWGAWYSRPDLLYQGGPTDGWRRSGNRVLETGVNIDGGNPDCR